MNGIKGKAILKDDVLRIIENYANYHTFVDDDAFQKFKSDIESLITFDMTVKVYSEHYCKECRKQYACGCTSDMLMSCADFEPAIENESTEQLSEIAENLYREAETVPVVTEQAETEHDAVSHPAHYTSVGIECIDCIKAALGENFMGFLIGNVIKYAYRYRLATTAQNDALAVTENVNAINHGTQSISNGTGRNEPQRNGRTCCADITAKQHCGIRSTAITEIRKGMSYE